MTLVIGSTASETHLDPHEDYRQAHPAVGRSDQDRKVSRQVASLAFCAEFGKVTVPAQPCPSGEFSKKVTPGAVGPSLNRIHLGPENRIFITFCPNHSPFLIC